MNPTTVLEVLQQHANPDGTTAPGLRAIQQALGMSSITVIRALHQLETEGRIIRIDNRLTGQPGRPRMQWQLVG